MKPGDVATTNSNSVFVTRKDKQKLANELGWRRGVVILENATLAEAASELNRYNSKQLVIADPVTARRRIAGTFRTNDLDDFTELAEEVLRIACHERRRCRCDFTMKIRRKLHSRGETMRNLQFILANGACTALLTTGALGEQFQVPAGDSKPRWIATQSKRTLNSCIHRTMCAEP